MERKFKQWWSQQFHQYQQNNQSHLTERNIKERWWIIPPISSKQSITFQIIEHEKDISRWKSGRWLMIILLIKNVYSCISICVGNLPYPQEEITLMCLYISQMSLFEMSYPLSKQLNKPPLTYNADINIHMFQRLN